RRRRARRWQRCAAAGFVGIAALGLVVGPGCKLAGPYLPGAAGADTQRVARMPLSMLPSVPVAQAAEPDALMNAAENARHATTNTDGSLSSEMLAAAPAAPASEAGAAPAEAVAQPEATTSGTGAADTVA